MRILLVATQFLAVPLIILNYVPLTGFSTRKLQEYFLRMIYDVIMT